MGEQIAFRFPRELLSGAAIRLTSTVHSDTMEAVSRAVEFRIEEFRVEEFRIEGVVVAGCRPGTRLFPVLAA